MQRRSGCWGGAHRRRGRGTCCSWCLRAAAAARAAVADAAALTALLLPMMVKAGHDKARAGGLIASAGIIAPVIPPSIGFVIFGLTLALSRYVSLASMLAAASLPFAAFAF